MGRIIDRWPLRSPGSSRVFDSPAQSEHIDQTRMTHAVNKEGGRPVDAAAHAAEEVLADGGRRGVGGHLSVEAVHVEAGLAGVEAEMAVGKLRLVFEEGVVHLPKAVLQTGGFGGLC